MKQHIQSKQWIASAIAIALIGAMTPPAISQERIGTSTIRFSEDTIVEFEVQFTQGANRSEFGVIVNPDPSIASVTDASTFNQLKDSGRYVPLFVETQPFDQLATSSDAGAFSNDPNFRVGDFLGTVNAGTIVDITRQGSVRVPNVEFVQSNPNAANGRGTITVAYEFKANTPYLLYLGTYTSANNVFIRSFASNNIGAAGTQGDLEGARGGGDRGEAIFWEDQGEGIFNPAGFIELVPSDDDFNDFVLVAGGVLVEVPCVKLPDNIR
ncbi:MAG: hypothetical protein SAJ12_08895 [Jaaginema sp. PMC 1079.18]|nr:hypothetical protein [Jaaginema sp. PMC 1080.18]MEC4851117.1 hypothetical protein [Jaaginema sp. PMC 1079.18]MEC4867369.1 hypothetical protein [Jaaginema sp. PMC 1078.18]